MKGIKQMKTNFYDSIDKRTYDEGLDRLVVRLENITNDTEYENEHERLASEANNDNLSGLTIAEAYYLICEHYGADRGNSFLASHV